MNSVRAKSIVRTTGCTMAIIALSIELAGCAMFRPPHERIEDRLMRDVEEASSQFAPPETRVASTGSLWNELAAGSLVSDTRAARPGDLITVKVMEDTEGSQQATTDLAKEGKVDLGAPVLGGLEKNLTRRFPNLNPAQILNTDGSKTFKGDGATSRKTSISATLTARVIGVYPNGDMAITGRKDVDVNHERQVVTMVGIVRAMDIASDNTVSSDKIAELTVHLSGRGDVNDQQREGWFVRMLQKVWPF